MGDGNGNNNLNFPDYLFSSKSFDSHSNLKDEALGVHGGVKGITVGLLDDSKDQLLSDSSIPLSPQWLYSKPVDAKTPTNPAGLNSSDPSLKDNWRLEGSQDKKDWRKTAPDVDINRRWREEERDTSLLGRRNTEKMIAVRILLQPQRIDLCLLIAGMTVVVLAMILEGRISGHQDGVLKIKRRILEVRKRMMLRRKMVKQKNNLLVLTTEQALTVTLILVINGGHGTGWKLKQLVWPHTVLHLDSGRIKDVLKAPMWDFLLEEEGQISMETYKLEGLPWALLLDLFLWIRTKLY